MQKSPDVLADRARAIVARFGHTVPAADHLSSTEWRRRLAEIGSPVVLHLRLAAKPLVPLDAAATVTASDSAPGSPGDLHVVFGRPTALYGSLMLALAQGAFPGLSVWIVYVALEPHVRRRIPELLVGWARVLEGRWATRGSGATCSWGSHSARRWRSSATW